VEAGESDRGRALIFELCGGPELPHLIPPLRGGCFESLALSDLERGRLDDARAWMKRSEATVEAFPLRSLRAVFERARARVLTASDEADEAAELALESARRFEALGMRLEAARSRLVAGQAFAAAGAKVAGDELERAEAAFAACEAEPQRRRAAGALRALGRRPPQRAAAAAQNGDGVLAALTARQREIARLVAQGHTNREIAEILVVTEKTVEKHLARVFARVGVNSRVALTVLVAGEGG
jgi:DNA-binding CsgD family transcriptional regulator